LGYKSLNEVVTRPAAAEELTILVGQKGSGKSIFAKSIENILINTSVPVLSLNLEMSEQSTMDRLLCIRTGISLEDLQKVGMPQQTLDTVFRGLGELATYDNYLYCPMSYMDLSTIDSIIYRAKNIFKQKGILKEDQYMFVMIDSLDMVKGFGEPYEIKENIDRLHAIYRKHKCHIFALVQANEQKFRSGKIWTKPEELDSYHITLADIYGGSYYAARARVVMSINRPLHLKRQFFPERMEQWDIEDDILSCSIIKQNDGALARCNFLFDTNFKITQLKDGVQVM
jgi:energy-coupling factor transporter ATP-binding protein EcfA2